MLATAYQQFIHQRTYSRWLNKEQRRETWEETVARYCTFFRDYVSSNHGIEIAPEINEAYSHIVSLEVMPSMRALMTAGPALARDHIAGFNCSYAPINDTRVFGEIVYILMCGTGVGYSVERQYVNELPDVPDSLNDSDTIIRVADSKLGWARAYQELLALLYSGQIPKWDVSAVRPKGAPLKTFGGRASGPQPLVNLFEFTVKVFKKAIGRKLESIEVHDIVCKIGDVVVSGGVRRSALISLSNLSDLRMRDAKSGDWQTNFPHRRLANNSVAYTEKPEVGHFMGEWLSLYQSMSGERGIFNRQSSILQCRRIGRRTEIKGEPIDFGTNPCGEIILRPKQFCNLSEVVAREFDTYDSLLKKIRVAAFLGTIQSCLTDYRYISKQWRENSAEERLLGVSITGIMDNMFLRSVDSTLIDFLEEGRLACEKENEKWAEILGIPASAARTCIKPSGTVSQLVNSSCGIHERHAPYYIRRVQADIKDPLTKMMIAHGFPWEPLESSSDHHVVFAFPIKSPKNTVCESTAIGSLELWKAYKKHWCDHNPSTTIYVRENEWPEVGGWVWNNFDEIGGLAFLPHAGDENSSTYKQLPYETINEEKYVELKAKMPKEIDWSQLTQYEKSDHTTGSKELACAGGQCEV